MAHICFEQWNKHASYLRYDYEVGRGWRRTTTLDEQKYAYFQQKAWDVKYAH